MVSLTIDNLGETVNDNQKTSLNRGTRNESKFYDCSVCMASSINDRLDKYIVFNA